MPDFFRTAYQITGPDNSEVMAVPWAREKFLHHHEKLAEITDAALRFLIRRNAAATSTPRHTVSSVRCDALASIRRSRGVCSATVTNSKSQTNPHGPMPSFERR